MTDRLSPRDEQFLCLLRLFAAIPIAGTAAKKHGKHNDSGFTLIELITVMTIIMMLAMMTIGSIQKASGEARRIQCLNNMRQMVMAAHLYANDSDGNLPPAYQRDFDSGQTRTWESYLWNLGTEFRIHQCPAFHGKAMYKDDRYTGYNYNASYVGGQTLKKNGAVLPGSTVSANLAHIHDPERCALFGDGEYASGANKFMRSPYPGKLDADSSLTLAGTQGFRHRGRTNIGFADGHVDSLRERYTASGSSGKPAADCGFISSDNELYDLE